MNPDANALARKPIPQVRHIEISMMLNGWTVLAGCQTLVFNDPGQLLELFGRWLNDPGLVETQVIKEARHRHLIDRYPPPPIRSAVEGVARHPERVHPLREEAPPSDSPHQGPCRDLA